MSSTGRPRAETVTWATFQLAPAEPALITARLEHPSLATGARTVGDAWQVRIFRNPQDAAVASSTPGVSDARRRCLGEPQARQLPGHDEAGTAADVRRLGDPVKGIVRAETGRELVEEVVFAGDWSGWGAPLWRCRVTDLAPQHVAVLLGGLSRSTTCRWCPDGRLAGALAGRGHPVDVWLNSIDGRWWALPEGARDPEVSRSTTSMTPRHWALRVPGGGRRANRIAAADPRTRVFPALHGPFGRTARSSRCSRAR